VLPAASWFSVYGIVLKDQQALEERGSLRDATHLLDARHRQRRLLLGLCLRLLQLLQPGR